MSASGAASVDGGDIANPHDAPPEHHVPLDHLRSLYYRPAAGSGILVPSSEVSPHQSTYPAQLTASQNQSFRTSSPAPRPGWQPHVRADSIPSRTARPATSSFWSHNVPHAHPGSHVSILAQGKRNAQDTRSPSPALSGSEHGHRQLSYIHAAPGSTASSFSLDLDRADISRGLQPPASIASSSRRSSAFGYLPTRLLPVSEKKRILVTGGAGFVGSHLVDRLMLMGHEVLVIDNFFTGQKNNLAQWNGHPNFELMRHDVVQPLVVEVDQIYHLACPASPISYQANQVKTIKTNFMGSINMLGLAKRTKARFLLASTSEVYGDPDVHPQPETYNGNVNPVGPRACYDEGKRVAETLTYGYYYQDGVDVRVARIFNTYGPRMHPHDGRVVSNLILQGLRGEPMTVFGDGSQTRSFMFIHDLIDGLISLMNAEPLIDTSALPTPLPQHPQHVPAQASAAAAMQAADIMTDAPDTIIPSTSTVTTPAPPSALPSVDVTVTATNGDASYFHPNAHRFDVHTPVNLGNPGEFTIMELVQLVQKCVAKVKGQDARRGSSSPSSVNSDTDGHILPESTSEIRFFAMPKDDPKQRRPDITRATSLLDWYPRWKLEDGLQEMTRWYWERIKEGSV